MQHYVTFGHIFPPLVETLLQHVTRGASLNTWKTCAFVTFVVIYFGICVTFICIGIRDMIQQQRDMDGYVYVVDYATSRICSPTHM